MPVVPKNETGFDAGAFENALDTRVRKGPSTVTIDAETHTVVEAPVHYTALKRFSEWKAWVDGLRNHLEALRLGVFGPDGVKQHLDTLDGRERLHHVNTDARLDALEAAHRPLGSGSG